jgi:hypothetical protein
MDVGAICITDGAIALLVSYIMTDNAMNITNGSIYMTGDAIGMADGAINMTVGEVNMCYMSNGAIY